LPAAWYLARNFTGVRLVELGSGAGDVTYSAVSMAINSIRKTTRPRPTYNAESKPYAQFWSFDGLAGQAFYCPVMLKVQT